MARRKSAEICGAFIVSGTLRRYKQQTDFGNGNGKGSIMKKKMGFLLATAATGAAVAPGAMAADLPTKAPAPMVIPTAASWAGWYIGAHAGAAWHQAQSNNAYLLGSGITGADATGFIGGGQIGFNWQSGNFVFGIEADGSWLNAKAKAAATPGFAPYTTTNEIRWLATVRPRFGLAVGNTMAYATAGVAFGGVRNSADFTMVGSGVTSQSKTRVGWVVGGGVEHMWTRNWTIALEGLFVDLGRSNVTNAIEPGKNTRFSNQSVIGRFKANYKW
jgi:outer membrane immunogenic protein